MSKTVKGCCPLDCPDSCCWVAHVKNGRVERLEGARDHPYTRGGLCAKVRSYEERTYAPDRILHPLRRTGDKGVGQFERISWDQALSEIASQFKDIIAQHGAQALLPLFYLGSMGVVQRQALMRVFNALGASQSHGNICGASGGMLLEHGHPIGFDPEEFVDSELIVLWGSNPLTTGHHQWHFMKEARRRRGTRIICIDPRKTRTAQKSDLHIPIRPGTDAILAAGIAHIMLEEGLADLQYTHDAVSDFDEFAESVQPWNPERVAQACEIPTSTIIELAHDFAKARPAAIRCGVGPQQTVQGDAFVRGLSALAILGGHWRLPGGGILIETYPEMDELAASCTHLRKTDSRSLDMATLGPNLTDQQLDPPIKGLMVWNMNPAVVLPNAGEVRSGLARADLFTVVLEHFLTDTARYADIVLPATTQLEHFDLQGAWGHHYVSVNNPAIEPLGESKSHGEVMRLLAQHLGLEDPAFKASDEEIAASALPKTIPFDELKSNGWQKNSPPRPRLETQTRKLKLVGQELHVPPSTSGDSLQLLTPKAHYFLNSSFANMPKQRKSQGQPTLEMHPDDALSRRLTDGQQVVLRNDLGALTTVLRVTDTIRTGAVALPGKWWSHPTKTNAVGNLLTSSLWSPDGQPAYNDTFVHVEGVG